MVQSVSQRMVAPRWTREYAQGMAEGRYQREVEEQLAEALPVRGQAALKSALAGLHELLALCRNPTHQKSLLWLWTEGYQRFGSVMFGMKGSGTRVWLPRDGADLALAVGETTLQVNIDPVSEAKGRHTVTSPKIEANPRSVAASLVSQLERDHAKAERRRDYELR